MKTLRSFAFLFGILALVAFVANTRVPAVADQRTFASQAAYYKLVANDFYRRLDTLKQFETSSGALDGWTKDAIAKISAYDTNAKSITTQINIESHAQYPKVSQSCQEEQNAFLGPYNSGLGWGTLKLDYDVRLATLKDTVDYLESKENKLLAKIADATLNGKPVATADNNLLTSTRYALNKLAALYHLMQAEDSYIDNVTEGMKQIIYGETCGRHDYVPPPTPTPKPTAKPTPSPVPTIAPKPTTTPGPTSKVTPAPAWTPCPLSVPAYRCCPPGMTFDVGLGKCVPKTSFRRQPRTSTIVARVYFSGKPIVNVVPSSSRDATSRRPPWTSTILRAM